MNLQPSFLYLKQVIFSPFSLTIKIVNLIIKLTTFNYENMHFQHSLNVLHNFVQLSACFAYCFTNYL